MGWVSGVLYEFFENTIGGLMSVIGAPLSGAGLAWRAMASPIPNSLAFRA
jgi:hypothetical protein